MEQNNNLPIVKDNNLPQKIKNGVIKGAKVVGWMTATLGALTATGFLITSPIVALNIISVIPIIGATYTAQKVITNTIQRPYKDLSFTTKKIMNGNIKIGQDPTRVDIMNKIIKYTNKEKVAFMQLQLLCGITRVSKRKKDGELLTFETETHEINAETIEKLQELGYVQDYEKTFKKKSRLILEKLGFGNIKGVVRSLNPKNKDEEKDMYNIKFKLTDKPMDLNDEKLRNNFLGIFDSKNGLMAKKDISLQEASDGSWQINYKRGLKEESSKDKSINIEREKFIKNIEVNPEVLSKEEIKQSTQLKDEQRENNDMCK